MEKKSLQSSGKSFNIYNDPKRSFSSSTSESFIFLVLDCYSYIAGEKVTGEILISSAEPLKNAELKLSSKGLEKVEVYDSRDKSQKIVDESVDVYCLEVVVSKWEELPAGQYVFPFNFKLPAFCPATFYNSGEDKTGNYVKAEVFYLIGTKLEVENGTSINHHRMIYIKNAKTLEKPGQSINAEAYLRGCCFSKGCTKFSLTVGNTDHCQVNGDVRYKLLPDNSLSKSPINQIIGSVLLDFEVHTKKGSFRVTKKLSESNRPTWISAYTNLIYEKDFEYQSDLKAASEELNPSSNHSSLIRCEYIIECLVFYDISCMRTPIVVNLPFQVNPQISYRKEDPSLPHNWNPQESSIYSFVVETTYSIPTNDSMITSSSLNIN